MSFREEKSEQCAEVQDELDETKEMLAKLRNEVSHQLFTRQLRSLSFARTPTTSAKILFQNMELSQDARAARTYRDELDILKEKVNDFALARFSAVCEHVSRHGFHGHWLTLQASRVDKFEAEITKYKEKLNELDFYRTRVEELREDNAILVETKNMLEDQMEASQKRVESVVELENDLIKCRQTIDEMCRVRPRNRYLCSNSGLGATFRGKNFLSLF